MKAEPARQGGRPLGIFHHLALAPQPLPVWPYEGPNVAANWRRWIGAALVNDD
jgi:hypothetical protein